jgi:hypothetical protein
LEANRLRAILNRFVELALIELSERAIAQAKRLVKVANRTIDFPSLVWRDLPDRCCGRSPTLAIRSKRDHRSANEREGKREGGAEMIKELVRDLHVLPRHKPARRPRHEVNAAVT